VLLLLWSAVVLLSRWGTWFWHLLQAPCILKFLFFRYIMSYRLVNSHWCLEKFVFTILMVRTCSPAQTVGMAAASSTETSVSIHHLTWRHSQKNKTFINTAVRSWNSAHSNISCGVRHIHTVRSDVMDRLFVCLLGPIVYTSNCTWGRNFFDSVTFSTRGEFWEWMDAWMN
jgi:hypothetical protein